MTAISSRGLLLISLVICAVGLLDAAIGTEWDLLVVIGLSVVVQLSIWFRQWSSRVPVLLRADLAHQLEEQAERSGEPFDTVLDRAVSWYHHRLYGDDRSDH
jgi:hypothetical protein